MKSFQQFKDILEMQVNRADITGGTQAAKNAAAGKGKNLYTPGKGVTKDFKILENLESLLVQERRKDQIQKKNFKII